MAKGQILKDDISQKILEMFPNSFMMDKNIYINGKENGEPVQIKVAFTTPKTPVEAPPQIDIADDWGFGDSTSAPAPKVAQKATEITAEERQTVLDLMRELDL